MAKVKVKWRGAFMLGNTALILYAYAVSKEQAWIRMCRRIAKRDGVKIGTVTDIFDGTKGNYTIEREP